jgi:hypothetical protein
MADKKLITTVVITAILAVVFVMASITIARNSTRYGEWPAKNFGIPFTYKYTVDTGGACIGFENETSEDGCGVRHFPKNNAYFAYDLTISLVAAGLMGVLFYRFSK